MPLAQKNALLELLAESTPIEDILDKVGIEPIVVLRLLHKEGHLDLDDFFDDIGFEEHYEE